MAEFLLDHALLPEGWARDVSVSVEAGTIVSVTPERTADGAEHIRGITLPGLPNVHSHAFQRGMAGLAETRGPDHDSFWTWRQVMYRFLDALTPDDVEAITAYAMIEMLENGFTALGEFHYLHHAPDGRPYTAIAALAERIVAAAGTTGIGLTLLPVFYAYGGFGGRAPDPGQRRFINDVDGYLRLIEESRKAVSRLDGAVVGIAPHSLRAVTPETLRDLSAAASDGPIHIHAAEQILEVEQCLSWSGRRPIEWLLDHADVDRRWCLIHATHMNTDEVARLARTGAVAGLCPLTEASLGDGIFDGAAYLGRGGAWGVGTDSNIEISAPAELKQLEYTQRLKHQARNVLAGESGRSTGRALYEGALAGGAQALGRRIGAIAPGCRADFVVLDREAPDFAAVSGDRWLDAYVFVAGKAAIERVVVGGREVVANGRHTRRDAVTRDYLRTMERLAIL